MLNDERVRGTNFACFHAGSKEEWAQFRLEPPDVPMLARGKLFLRNLLGSAGLESLNAVPPGKAIPFLHRHQESNAMRQRNSVAGKWALVTGASSGFGVQFAMLLAAQGANLILVARRAEAMEQLAERLRGEYKVRVVVEAMDLSAPDAAAALKTRTDAQGLVVDLLVNNAGYGVYGEFVGQPLARTMNMLRLNIVTLTELTHVYARDMAQRGSGHILLVASLLGFQAVPGYAAYAASKAYVLHFGEALHAELGPRGVSVTVLAPGAATTAFGDVAGETDKGTLQKLKMSPHTVAEIGIRAMLRRRSSVVAGLRNGLIVFFNRFMPRALQRGIFRLVMAGEV